MSSRAGSRDRREAPDVHELSAIMRDRNRQFKEQLDLADADQALLHHQALAAAANLHARVRENAERARQQFEVEQQAAIRQREVEEQMALEHSRRQLMAQEERVRKQREAVEAAEAERRNQEQRERRLEEERQRRFDEQRRAAEAARERQRSQAVPPPGKVNAPPMQPSTPSLGQSNASAATAANFVANGGPSHSNGNNGALTQAAHVPATQSNSNSPRNAEHQEYLALHKTLKNFRKEMLAMGKQNPQLKSTMGDSRRTITKTVGQMTSGSSNEAKTANRNRIVTVRDLLSQARQQMLPSFDVRTFIVPSRHVEGPDSEFQISGLFIYLLNIFTKSVIKQYIGEAGISPEKAEPVGLLLATVFGQRGLQWKDTTYLIDILLAKFHRVCPVLFGIYGPPNTAAGRARSGWLSQLSAQENSERMTGLGAGYAAITLRDFSKSQSKNPMPVSLLWQSLASIVNTPANLTSDTHFLVLKALLDPVYVEKLVRFYGNMALALVRKAVLEFPARSNTAAANALKVLPDLYERQLKLVIA